MFTQFGSSVAEIATKILSPERETKLQIIHRFIINATIASLNTINRQIQCTYVHMQEIRGKMPIASQYKSLHNNVYPRIELLLRKVGGGGGHRSYAM